MIMGRTQGSVAVVRDSESSVCVHTMYLSSTNVGSVARPVSSYVARRKQIGTIMLLFHQLSQPDQVCHCKAYKRRQPKRPTTIALFEAFVFRSQTKQQAISTIKISQSMSKAESAFKRSI
jgi:hypothetical protein